jgi:hypothetical protein
MTTQTAPARPAPVSSRNGKADPGPLHAAHTPNFPAVLRQLGASLLVTTYQAGNLVMVRDEGDHLNTHYRVNGRFKTSHLWALQNQPGLCISFIIRMSM